MYEAIADHERLRRRHKFEIVFNNKTFLNEIMQNKPQNNAS